MTKYPAVFMKNIEAVELIIELQAKGYSRHAIGHRTQQLRNSFNDVERVQHHRGALKAGKGIKECSLHELNATIFYDQPKVAEAVYAATGIIEEATQLLCKA